MTALFPQIRIPNESPDNFFFISKCDLYVAQLEASDTESDNEEEYIRVSELLFK